MPRKELPHVPGICNRCGKPSGEYKTCPACRARNKAAQDRFHGRTNGPKICEEEGCKTEIPPLAHFCKACAKKRKQERDKAYKVADRQNDIKPHRPEAPPPRKQLISEEEQARLDAEASARDRAWNKRFFKEHMGLESPAPGLPLASEVVTPPPEVWEEYLRNWKPQSREGGTLVLPCLMKDCTGC